MNYFQDLSVNVLLKISHRNEILYYYYFILSFFIALIDEWYQHFSEGRTGQLIDVFTFDLLGIILAIFGVLLAKKYNVKQLLESSNGTKKI